jgi:hypothetical protein
MNWNRVRAHDRPLRRNRTERDSNMKRQASKARSWLVTLTMTAATLAVGQSSPPPASSALRGFDSSREVQPVPSTSNPGKVASTFATTAAPSLPDAPSAVAASQSSQDAPIISEEGTRKPPAPPTNATLGLTFLVANGVLFGSTIANAEMIARCRPSSCQAVPDAIRSRPALYGIGISSSLAVSYVSYRLKRGATRWWIAPVAVLTAGNIVYAVHASRWSR